MTGQCPRGAPATPTPACPRRAHADPHHARTCRAAGHASSELSCGPLRLDTKASKADINGIPLKLTSHEFRLLAYLMHHMGEVVSRTELVEHLYDQDFDRDSNTIEVFVGRLRKKMGVDMIETVRGMGYRMREPQA